ncbi:18008_t:CDS:10, partial [Acaulospora morrowiae]
KCEKRYFTFPITTDIRVPLEKIHSQPSVMSMKVGYFIVEQIDCSLNGGVNLKSNFIGKGERVKLLFQYNGVGKITEKAEVLAPHEKQICRFGCEQIIFEIDGNHTEFEIFVYDARRPGLEGDLGSAKVSLIELSGKVSLRVGTTRKHTGEISFNLVLLSLDVPSDSMARIRDTELMNDKIGMILIENVKVRLLNGRNEGWLKLKLNDESHSTKAYWSTKNGGKGKELKVALPLICTQNPSLKVIVDYGDGRGIAIFFLLQFEDIWSRMMNGELCSVKDHTIHSGNEMCAKISFDISCHCLVTARKLFDQPLTDFDGPPNVEPPSFEDGESSAGVSPPEGYEPYEPYEPSEPNEPNEPPITPNFPSYTSPQFHTISPSISMSSMRTSRTRNDTPRIVCQRFVVVSAHQRCRSITTGPLQNKVSRGKHIYTPGEFFIKEITNETSFHNEVRWLEKLYSKAIVKFVDVDLNKQIIITKDHGPSLDSVHRKLCRNREDILSLVKGICEGVKFIHDYDVVHMDLCPANIICGERTVGNRKEIKVRICDFEHSRALGNPIQLAQNYGNPPQQHRRPSYNDEDPRNQSQQPFTIGFTAPELLGITRGNVDEQVLRRYEELSADFNMDIFALAGILYFLITKRLMYNDVNELKILLEGKFARVKQDIANEGIAGLVLEMSKENPDDRYNIDDVLQDLRELMNGRRRGRDRSYSDDD